MRDSVSRDAGTPPEAHSHQNANLVSSFRFAFVGFMHVLKTQRNMRIHLSAAVAVIALGLYLGLDWLQWAVLCLAIGFVIVAEMFNTVETFLYFIPFNSVGLNVFKWFKNADIMVHSILGGENPQRPPNEKSIKRTALK